MLIIDEIVEWINDVDILIYFRYCCASLDERIFEKIKWIMLNVRKPAIIDRENVYQSYNIFK